MNKITIVIFAIIYWFLIPSFSLSQSINNHSINFSDSQNLIIDNNKKKRLNLPLKEIARKIFKYSDYKINTSTIKDADYDIYVELNAKSVTGNYTIFGLRHSGAHISGTIKVKSSTQLIIEKLFEGRKSPPFMLHAFGGGSPGYETPEKAPIEEALYNSNYYSQLFEVINKISGINYVTAALKDGDNLVREGALNAIINLKYEVPLDIIKNLLADYSSEIYNNSLRLLSKRKDPGIVDLILSILPKTKYENARAVFDLLKEHNDSKIPGALYEYCIKGVNSKNNISKDYAIQLAKDYKIILPLAIIDKLINDNDYAIRRLSIGLLKERKEPEITGMLFNLLSKSYYYEAKEIIDILLRFNDGGMTEKIKQSLINSISSKNLQIRSGAIGIIVDMKYDLPFDTIEKLVSDKSAEIRDRSIPLLLNSTEPQIVNLLLKVLPKAAAYNISKIIDILSRYSNSAIDEVVFKYRKHTDQDIRKSVINYFSTRDNAKSTDILLEFALEKDQLIRTKAIKSLEFKSDPNVTTFMITLLNDPVKDIRETAARHIGKSNDKRAVESLIKLLNEDGEASMREIAAEALGRLNDSKALIPLLNCYQGKEKYYNVKTKALNSFISLLAGTKTLSSPHDARQLTKLIYEKDDKIYKAYKALLESLNDSSSIQYIIYALKDSVAQISRSAATSLAYIKGELATNALIDALNNDKRWDVRYRIAESLGLKKVNAAVPLLIPILKDSLYKMREVAAWGLGNIGNEDAAAHLLEIIGDTSRVVRFYAVEALGKLKFAAAVTPVANLMAGEKVSYVKIKCAEVLGDLGDNKGIQPLIKILQNDKNIKLLPSVITSLGKLKAEEAIEILIEIMITEPALRDKAADALIEINSLKTTDVLIPVLKNKSTVIRQAAVKVFSVLKDTRSIEPLIDAMEDNINKKCVDAIQYALEKITGNTTTKGYNFWVKWWDENQSKYER